MHNYADPVSIYRIQCANLKKTRGLEGRVYFPDSPDYENRLSTYWSKSAALEPWCMVQPTTAEDVSATIKKLVAGDCPFGIRGGGHGSFPLSNAVEKGITIDFGWLFIDPHQFRQFRC